MRSQRPGKFTRSCLKKRQIENINRVCPGVSGSTADTPEWWWCYQTPFRGFWCTTTRTKNLAFMRAGGVSEGFYITRTHRVIFTPNKNGHTAPKTEHKRAVREHRNISADRNINLCPQLLLMSNAKCLAAKTKKHIAARFARIMAERRLRKCGRTRSCTTARPGSSVEPPNGRSTPYVPAA